jgi:hypothetical protein
VPAARHSPSDLGQRIGYQLVGRQLFLERKHGAHGWVEVGTRDLAQRRDENNQHRTSSKGIAKQRQGDVAASEALTHDARADDRRQEQAGAQRLRGDSLCSHATFGLSEVLPSMRPISRRWF